MRDIRIAFTNWLRICKNGGILYICVSHETYYEKGVWPSKNNSDHKHSFTIKEKSNMPKNVVIYDFLNEFKQEIEIIDVRENLKNYDFQASREIDQTADLEKNVCAQIDIILRKKQLNLSEKWKAENDKRYLHDKWTVIMPIRIKMLCLKCIPKPIYRILKKIIRRGNTKK